MFSLLINTDDKLLKLCLTGSPSPQEVQRIFNKIETARSQFHAGYQLWIKLPADLRTAQLEEEGKLDLMAYTGRSKGLKKVVIQAPLHCRATARVVTLLRTIYQGINVPIDLVTDKAGALKSLGLLWRKHEIKIAAD
jgi:hypothetical protein